MKDIYLVVTPFFPTNSSFRGPFIYDQVNALRRNSDYDIIVLQPTNNKDQRTSYNYFEEKVFLFKTKQTPSNLFTGFFDKYNCRSFIESIKNNQIDLTRIRYVHCHTMPLGVYGLALKKINPEIKVIVQHHCRDPYSLLYGRLAGWHPNLKYKYNHSLKIAENVDLHVSVSRLIEGNLLKFPSSDPNEDYCPYLNRISPLKKHSPTKITNSYVLYNGVDTTKFYPNKAIKRNLSGDFDINIGCIANFQLLKDQLSLIKAIKLILRENIKPRLSLIGSGPTLDECKNYVNEYNLHDYVVFKKEVDHSQLIDYYNNLDLFILPSVYEGFGCVYTEAYECGIPFMLCEGQGATEYIPKNQFSYWVLKKNSPEDIADKVIQFIKLKPKQSLLYPTNIDILISGFLNKLREI